MHDRRLARHHGGALRRFAPQGGHPGGQAAAALFRRQVGQFGKCQRVKIVGADQADAKHETFLLFPARRAAARQGFARSAPAYRLMTAMAQTPKARPKQLRLDSFSLKNNTEQSVTPTTMPPCTSGNR